MPPQMELLKVSCENLEMGYGWKYHNYCLAAYV
nr:MAG TPA_asm: hypothetical protein [Caudoviricetes sp.]